jgi:hypothetical protein
LDLLFGLDWLKKNGNNNHRAIALILLVLVEVGLVKIMAIAFLHNTSKSINIMTLSTSIFLSQNSNSEESNLWSKINHPKTLVIFAFWGDKHQKNFLKLRVSSC